MLARLRVPFGWKELVRRTWKESLEDDVLSLAAQQAYYFFFGLFPALLTLISLASFLPIENLTDEIIRYLGQFAPPEVLAIINDQIQRIAQSESAGVLTFAFLLTIWSTSGAMVSIITTLNTAYDITEGRSLLKVRWTAILLTLGVAAFILVSMALIIAGPPLAERLAETLHMGQAFAWAWKILQWPLVFVLVATGIAIVYYYAPDAEQDWVWLTPGAVLATILWILVSLGLRLYLSYIGSFNETYGTLGGVMVLLLWFHVTALAILVGAEMNAETEHASPYGKAPGEKVRGQKKKIGAAAERHYDELKSKGLLRDDERRTGPADRRVASIKDRRVADTKSASDVKRDMEEKDGAIAESETRRRA
jgi:membrane protein